MKISKRLTALLALTIAILAAFGALSPAVALFGSTKEEPSVSAFAKSNIEGSLISFSAEDFATRVKGGQSLDAIVIASMPESGILRVAGKEVDLGTVIDSADLGGLCYVPPEEGEIYTSFSFMPVFSKTGAGKQAVTVSLNLSATANSAPVAKDLEYETYAGVKLCAPLKYTDADGDPCTFEIEKAPTKGTVEINQLSFAYTPSEGKTGSDSFTYVARDEKGNVSKTATVNIDIVKRPQKDTFQYTDMLNSTSHNAALKLKNAGILIGETVGASNFFYPEKEVNRAEFVALVAAIIELPVPTMSVGTGLADNGDIPAWARSTIAAAVHEGIVQGTKNQDGNRVFSPSNTITRAEAAAIIDRALKLATDGRSLDFADAADAPAWACTSLGNTAYSGILPVFDDNTLRPLTAVNREDAAAMLCQMMEYKEASAKSGGIFGWFK